MPIDVLLLFFDRDKILLKILEFGLDIEITKKVVRLSLKMLLQ